MRKIIKGDLVKVITGKDKGKTGEIVKVLTKKDRIVVKGVNIITKHKKQSANEKGGLIKVEAPIHISNVMIVDSSNGKTTRVKFNIKENKKVRVFSKSGKEISIKK